MESLPRKLVLATHNPGKTRELRAILAPLGIELANLSDYPEAPEPEETGDTFEANAVIKAESARAFTGLPAVADDSGLAVDALGGAPGVRSARYAGAEADDSANRRRLLEEMVSVPPGKRTARFVSVVALALPDGSVRTFRGETLGIILSGETGRNGFGYDSLFFSHDLKKSFGEAADEEKNRVSHRARAIALMIEALKG